MRISLIALTLTLVVCQLVDADNIIKPNLSITDGAGPNADWFELKIIDTPDPNDFVVGSTTWFSAEASRTDGLVRITYQDTDLGVGRRWYSTDLDQPFSAATIAAGDVTLLGNNGGAQSPKGSVEVPFDRDFWLAVNTGFWSADNSVTEYEYFGWVQLNVDGDLNVTAVDSAFSLDCGAILSGRNAVPEPDAGLFALMAGAIVYFQRRAIIFGR